MPIFYQIKKTNYNNPILKSLLSTSVKVTPEIFPKIDKCINSVFKKLELKNNFNFFVTANHNQSQASCAMMPENVFCRNNNYVKNDRVA